MSLRTQGGVGSSNQNQNQNQRPNHAPMPSEGGFSAYGLKSTPGSDSNSPQFPSNTSQRQMPPSSSSSSSSKPNGYLARDGSQSKTGGGPGGGGGGNSSTSAPSTSSSSHSKSTAAQISPEQSRAIARTHFDALRSWLEKENALGNASSPRNNARDKLTRLTRQQFQELSTDVYDELVRRMEEQAGRPGEQPFLSVRGEFHPKRNQARQKLATLPIGRFRDLASDVYFELERRYPEFGEEEVPGDSYSPPPVPSLSAANRSIAAASNNNNNNGGGPPSSQNGANKGGPATVTRGGSGRVPTPTAPNAATNDVVVPNKSTMIVEEPASSSGGGGYDNENGARRTSGPNPSSSSQQYGGGGGQHSANNSYGGGSAMGNPRPITDGSDMDREQLSYEMGDSPQQKGGAGGSANASRVSQTSSIGTRFIGNYAGSEGGGRRSWEHEDREKVKSDYEYKITMLQSRMAEVQRENDDMRDALKSRTADTTRVRDLESQVRTHRDRYDDQTSTLQKLRTDFDALQNTRSRDGASSAAGSRGDVERLTRERTDADELANELRAEVSNLVDEIRSVNSKYEELLEQREKDQQDMAKLEDDVKTWRRKFEQAKTELRNVKATSQLFVGNIKMEADHMPASADGLIADVNVTSFQTCIDDLLSAARSKEPSSVLPAMRAVVLSVEKIDGDVQAVDPRRLQAFPLADQDRLQTLKAKTNATLSNLMTASKNHATSFGLSPVSLVDAAASHLSSTVIDLVRLLRIRRTTGAGSSGPFLTTRSQEGSREATPPMPPIKSAYGTGSGSIASSSTDALPQLSRGQNLSTRDPTSETSSLRSPRIGPGSNDYNNPTPRSAFGSQPPDDRDRDRDREREREREREEDRYRQPSPSGYSQGGGGGGGGSSYGNYGQSPRVPPVAAPPERASSTYDAEPAYNNNNNTNNNNAPSEGNTDYRGSVLTYGSPTNNGVDRQEENWEQLKNYLETQTEAIVHSIQSLLTAIRSGAQGEQLNENLTQIITIVSSIVAISKDALPDESRAEGDDILRDLADNCDKLSGMSQSSATAVFDKQTKQAMASASFGVAKSLKALNALLDSQADSLT